MKKSDINTPEVIKLSTEIAKYWRMGFYRGAWTFDPIYGVELFDEPDAKKATERKLYAGKCIPIPSISDCLEKLEILEWYLIEATTYTCKTGIESYSVEVARGWDMEPHIMKGEKTLHLALLSALLEVLKND